MGTQGVDVQALFRRIAPLWLGWLGCGAVGVWLWSVVSGMAAFDLAAGSSTVYGQDGNVVAAEGIAADVGWFGRIAMALMMGFSGVAMARELAILILAGTAAVVLAWAVHRRDGHTRAVAAAGIAVSLGVAVVGGLALASRTALDETGAVLGWGMGDMSGLDGQFAAWGVTGGTGAFFAWTFLVIGFLPLPRQSAPERSPEPQEPVGAVALPEVEELPAAPQPDSSVFERPAGWAESADEGSGGVVTGAHDPLSAYRRPEPLDQS